MFSILLALLACTPFQQSSQPNIIVILADDLGYGDVRGNQPSSPIPTPSLDAVAKAGVRFSDAHSGSAVCTPTRYGLLTGRYCWRSRLKRGVLGGYSGHLIEAERTTVADVLKSAGYHTACIGKWHLGMDMPRKKNVMDWDGEIKNGPNSVGFDYFWGISASLDFPPYVWIENQSFTAPGDQHFKGGGFPGYLRSGEIAADFDHRKALDQITERAMAYIEEQAASSSPFFLYLPLTAPHKPVMPAERFVGKSGVGLYGDFVMQTDWVVGQVDAALKKHDLLEHTLLIVSSDNGSFMYRLDAPESPQRAKEKTGDDGPALLDHVAEPKIQGYLSSTHRANGDLRGTKADIWEGGHRVPLLVRWPGQVEAGSHVQNTVSLVDVLATCAGAANASIPDDAGEDSFSWLPLLQQSGDWQRPPVIQHSANGTFAIRVGKWKFIDGKGAGGRGKLTLTDADLPVQLYDMDADLGERRNLAGEKPELVAELTAKLRQIQSGQ